MSESHASISNEAAAVLAECAFTTGLAVGSRIGEERTAKMTPEARAFWLAKHLLAIPIALERAARKGQSWEKHHRKIVLPEAARLGRLAAKFALEDSKKSEIVEITLEHVRRASKEVSEGKQCRAAVKSGGGGYCEDFPGNG